MIKNSMPLWIPKGDGLTVRWKCANSQPAMAASTAASTEATTSQRKVETPIASAIVVPSFSHRMARPGRLSSWFVTANAAVSAKARISTYRRSSRPT